MTLKYDATLYTPGRDPARLDDVYVPVYDELGELEDTHVSRRDRPQLNQPVNNQ